MDEGVVLWRESDLVIEIRVNVFYKVRGVVFENGFGDLRVIGLVFVNFKLVLVEDR